MGKYLNKDSKGVYLPAKGKVNVLLQDGGDVVTPGYYDNLIIVIDNGPFEAAVYIYNEEEYKRFCHPSDDRNKTFIIYPYCENAE